MKEILGRQIKGFDQSSVDPNSVPFKVKAQEKQRQEKLKKRAEEWAADGEAWKDAQKAERKKAKEKLKEEKKQNRERTRTEKRKAGRKGRADEWALLSAEEGLAKKLRSGRITAAQFQARVRKATKRVIGKDDGSVSGEDSSSEAEAPRGGDGARWLDGRRKKRRGKSKKH